MKFMPIDQDDDDDGDGNLDFDSMAAKIAADGGCVVVPDNLKQKTLSKTKRPGDADDQAAPAGNKATPAGDASVAAKEEEEPVEYDEHGKVALILARAKRFVCVCVCVCVCALLSVFALCACNLCRVSCVCRKCMHMRIIITSYHNHTTARHQVRQACGDAQEER